MGKNSKADYDFLRQLTEITESNMSHAQFGVSKLANEIGMSRSNLHLRLKKISGLSASQFIKQVRLKKAMGILQQRNITVSETAYDCGFQSVSYFIKCFREYYGFPPGEVEKKNIQESDFKQNAISESGNSSKLYLNHKNIAKTGHIRKLASVGLIFSVLTISFFVYQKNKADGFKTTSDGLNFDNSIAILPFKNLNKNSDYDYFSNGVVEAINRHLSQINELSVTSLTSSERYRKTEKSAREIGRELHVSSLLEGSIQRHESLVRIEVRLIDVETEKQLWAENYDRELKQIFKTQSEIAAQVVMALKKTLSPEEKKVLTQQMTENAEAYDLYLKGIYENRTYTRSGNRNAIELFQQSVALDSNYALSYAGLALCNLAKGSIFGSEVSASEALSGAKPYIDKALTINPALAEAHLCNGFYLLYNNWDFEGAERAYKKSIVNNFEDALAVYADFLNFTKRHEEAYIIAKKLDQIHPYYPNSRMILSLYYLERYSDAEEFAQSRLRLFNNYYTLDSYGFLKLNTGQYKEAIQIFEQIFELENVRYPRILGWMGAAYARLGQQDKAMKHIKELKAVLAKSNAGSPAFFIAVIYASLGDEESALSFLEQALDDHEMEVPWLISEPQFYSLHSKPAFQVLVQRVGFKWPV